MAEDEVCLLEAGEALGFFAEVNESYPQFAFCSGNFGNEIGYLATLVSRRLLLQDMDELRHDSAACKKQFFISSYRFLSVKRVHPLGSCHVSEQTRAIGKPFRFDINAIQHRQ